MITAKEANKNYNESKNFSKEDSGLESLYLKIENLSKDNNNSITWFNLTPNQIGRLEYLEYAVEFIKKDWDDSEYRISW